MDTPASIACHRCHATALLPEQPYRRTGPPVLPAGWCWVHRPEPSGTPLPVCYRCTARPPVFLRATPPARP